MIDVDALIGTHDILLMTIDTLRFDVARDALAAVRGRFDTAPEPATLIAAQPARFTAHTHTQKRRIEQANIAMAWSAPGRLSPDNIPLKLFSEILGGGGR